MESTPINDALLIYEDNYKFTYNIFNRYMPNLLSLFQRLFKITRSYEEPWLTYYLVFAPYKRYTPKPTDLLRLEKYCRKKFKYERLIIVRETMETSVHYNILITTKYDLLKLHKANIPKLDYKPDIQCCPTIKDQQRVLLYMLKEGHKREMVPNIDTFVYTKN